MLSRVEHEHSFLTSPKPAHLWILVSKTLFFNLEVPIFITTGSMSEDRSGMLNRRSCALFITILLKNTFSPLGLCFVLVQSILCNHTLVCSYC